MALIEALFNHTASIWRRTRSSDGQGGWSVAFEQVGAGVMARLRPAGGTEREAYAQQDRVVTHVLYALHGTDVARGDQVDIDGLTLDVLGVREPSRAGYHLEVDCSERQDEATGTEGS